VYARGSGIGVLEVCEFSALLIAEVRMPEIELWAKRKDMGLGTDMKEVVEVGISHCDVEVVAEIRQSPCGLDNANGASQIIRGYLNDLALPGRMITTNRHMPKVRSS